MLKGNLTVCSPTVYIFQSGTGGGTGAPPILKGRLDKNGKEEIRDTSTKRHLDNSRTKQTKNGVEALPGRRLSDKKGNSLSTVMRLNKGFFHVILTHFL